jgi:hypothetical protein
MKTLSIIKAAFAASLAALLAACGDGGDSAAPPADLPPVAWASPAVFVTPGLATRPSLWRAVLADLVGKIWIATEAIFTTPV